MSSFNDLNRIHRIRGSRKAISLPSPPTTLFKFHNITPQPSAPVPPTPPAPVGAFSNAFSNAFNI